MIEIIDPGPLATVQDRGRYGFASLGVPRSGAFDRAAHQLANRLVGNRPDAATIEFTLGGLTVRLHDATTFAVTGARVPGADWGTATTLPAGCVLTFGAPSDGLRTYLAVRGGIDVDGQLGSRSTDTLGGLGPAPLSAGLQLPIGPEPHGAISDVAATWSVRQPHLRVLDGPRADWFSTSALDLVTSARWTVAADSNRIGVRLDGPHLDRTRPGELASEPTLPGALQVPPDGRPILLGPDAPVTGGYPVIAVARRGDVDIAAQLRPGDVVRFTR